MNEEQYHNRTVCTLTKISPNIVLYMKIAVNKINCILMVGWMVDGV